MSQKDNEYSLASHVPDRHARDRAPFSQPKTRKARSHSPGGLPKSSIVLIHLPRTLSLRAAIGGARNAHGLVTVQVLVNEDGTVKTARAVGGHPPLQQAAVKAARKARFSPTTLSGQPVKVSGVVTYNFVLR